MAFIDSGKTFDKEENHTKITTRMKNEEVSSYLLRIPPKLHHLVRIKLAKDNKKLRDVLLGMLEEYIKK